jgi:hypothetical protein
VEVDFALNLVGVIENQDVVQTLEGVIAGSFLTPLQRMQGMLNAAE